MTKWLTDLISGASSGLLARVAIWAGVAVLTVAGSLAVALWIQTARLDAAQTALGENKTLLEVCRGINQSNSRALAEIERQAQADLADAQRQRERAERIAAEARADRAETGHELARLRSRLDEAIGGDECAGRPVPADLDRMYRRAPGEIRDGDGDTGSVRGDPGRSDRAAGSAGDPGGDHDLG